MEDEVVIACHALTSYLYRTNGKRFVLDVFGEVHPNYLAEKAGTYDCSKQRALGALDFGNFQKIVRIALERHGQDSREWLEGNRAHFIE